MTNYTLENGTTASVPICNVDWKLGHVPTDFEEGFVDQGNKTVILETRFNTDRDDPASIGANLTITSHLVNETLFNVTLGAMYTLDFYQAPANVTKMQFKNTYSFSAPKNLIIPYTVCLLLPLPFILLGFNSLRLNGVPAMDGSFLQILTTATGSKKLENAAAGGCLSGDNNMPKELLNMKIRFGEFVGSDNRVLRTGFGTEDEVVPLVRKRAVLPFLLQVQRPYPYIIISSLFNRTVNTLYITMGYINPENMTENYEISTIHGDDMCRRCSKALNFQRLVLIWESRDRAESTPRLLIDNLGWPNQWPINSCFLCNLLKSLIPKSALKNKHRYLCFGIYCLHASENETTWRYLHPPVFDTIPSMFLLEMTNENKKYEANEWYTRFPLQKERTHHNRIVKPLSIDFRILQNWLSLCQKVHIDHYYIDQQNNTHATCQIQQMDLIYRNSQLTIAAAAGLGPAYGLPGIGHPWKPPFAVMVSEHLFSPGKTANSIISDEQVYYECDGNYTYESFANFWDDFGDGYPDNCRMAHIIAPSDVLNQNPLGIFDCINNTP
ncbi:hypothetical protein G7Y89_g2416 [Cudoniella acicularis]|uniref:Heterokaryon incompatibility domain-containing protein n=1 Tax=Cudoniella acicularis TaxID=354080 RepID=A0A8H4RTD3_9HELO|nr:hypothetical protein G7Y89_g2416 [Cudoniella acicularis]